MLTGAQLARIRRGYAPPMPVPGTCVFCGGGPLTLEHVWPQWVRRDVYSAATSFVHDFAPRTGTVDPWSSQGIDITVRAVCATCNGGWMSALEGVAKTTLIPMSEGKYRVLKNDDQQIICLWALKTALMFKCLEMSYEGFNAQHHSALYSSKPALHPTAMSGSGGMTPATFAVTTDHGTCICRSRGFRGWPLRLSLRSPSARLRSSS